ncbi:transcription antitermination factor NusB [Marivirga sp. S37H4]|uniref:Transcription antitermination protein NusB n=1 Tax=Marivirga aurantiaca TaxID=2802615 RepID=A0A935CAE1_9BACT|nr:transcription antitermination factor NusB [Marivirga aurantiaca]MBK6266545.1 transcription antitermination factor NusB [Marivirga aurantiaca]
MLNRRSLRIKAMQSLYAVQKCEEADYELAKSFIEDYFAPDLNSMEVQNKEQLSSNAKVAKTIFKNNYQHNHIKEETDSSPEIRKAVSQAIDYYQNMVKKDHVFIKKNMVDAVDTLLENYYLIIKLTTEFAELAKEEIELRKKRMAETGKQVFESELNLYKNQAIQIFKENEDLHREYVRHGTSWEDEKVNVRQWYRDILRKEDFYQEYLMKNHPTFEEDVAVIDQIIKQVVFKNETLAKYMEEKDLYWAENKSALKSMLKKTLKSLKEGSEHVELIELSANWEDDSDFFKKLFDLTLENNEEYEELVSKYTKNWATERIASIDMIILKMAVCEMMNFSSIPVKVSINEYIDLSKNYSTQKSKIFVNGMLDKISEELESQGKIRKSGRGLIDNK